MKNVKETPKEIMDKIRKLIKKQESATQLGSTAEAEAFAAKVQELLNKYNLSKGDLNVEENKNEMEQEGLPLYFSAIGGRSNYYIYRSIALNNWCEVIIFGNQKQNKFVIIGTPDNIEVCKYIHSAVVPVFFTVGKAKYKEYCDNGDYLAEGKKNPVGYDTFMRTFLKGCSDGLYEKLHAEKEEFIKKNSTPKAIEMNGCSAMVLVDNNKLAIDLYKTQNFGKLGTVGGTKKNFSGGAYGKGLETGRNVSINKGVTGTAKPITRKALK